MRRNKPSLLDKTNCLEAKMENIKEMTERHKREIQELQDSCKHEKVSGWLDFYWAPMHSSGTQVKQCEFCGKVVQKKICQMTNGITGKVEREEQIIIL
jgi:hypothetical protein